MQYLKGKILNGGSGDTRSFQRVGGTVSEGKLSLAEPEGSRVAWEGERWSEEMVIIIEGFTVGV